MSGHIFFKERWYGFDDGLYAGARLLEILCRAPNVMQALEALPDSITTPELNVAIAKEGENHALIAELQKTARFEGASEVITIDGLRVEYADGFGLARLQHHAGRRAAFRGRHHRCAGTHPGRFRARAPKQRPSGD